MTDDKKMGFTHDNKNNKTVDWWTPPWVFETLKEEFDIDVAAPPGGVPWIPAKKVFTQAEDGLAQLWDGFIWCNPPYGKETGIWLEKMSAHRNGIALVFARTDCKWYHQYCRTADALLFKQGRISFVDGLNSTGNGGAGAGSLFVAWGERGVEALSRLAHLGHFIRLDNQQ